MNDIKPYLACGVILLGFGYIFTPMPKDDQIIIAIVGWVGIVLGYYFGSSTGASKKDETINNLTNTKKMPYTVASLTQTEAEDFAKNGDPAFKLGTTNNYYTYTDVAPSAPTTTISNIQNEGMFIMTYDGTTPVFKKRKMFPR